MHNHFLRFNDKIRLSQSKREQLKTSRNEIRRKIKRWFEENQPNIQPRFFIQGSLKMDTIVNPYNGHYDVDDGLYIDYLGKPKHTPSSIHSWIINAVNGASLNTVNKYACVRVEYSRGYHIDIPCYSIENGKIHLAHLKDGWVPSDPREFSRWFLERAKANPQLLRIVRYLKSWAEYRSGDMPSGFILTILASRNYVANRERDDLSLHHTLDQINISLKASFTCYRPTTPTSEDLFSQYSHSSKQNFLTGLESLSKDIRQAIESKELDTAVFKMQKHFGERFIKNL